MKCSKGSEPGEHLNSHVTTDHLKWEPVGEQETWLSDPGPAEKDILINKLRPGHEMEIKLFAVKVRNHEILLREGFKKKKFSGWVGLKKSIFQI